MKFFYVYVLRSLTKDFIYVGFTSDLKHRFQEHNNREELSTKDFAPFDLIHYEAYESEKDAKRKEYFKTTKGKTTLRIMLSDYFQNHPYMKITTIVERPEGAIVCGVCNGAGKAATQSFFAKNGKRTSGHIQICLTCKGKGWTFRKEMEEA